jgi:hypothetical protein
VLSEREDLVYRLNAYAGRREGLRAEVRAASGTTDGDNLRASVAALTKLARGWIRDADEENRLLLEERAIDEERLAHIESLAQGLTGAGVDVSLAGAAAAVDAPEVNREEGAVLFAMIDAMEAFAAAKKRNDLVPRLVPPPKIAHALVDHPHSRAKKPQADVAKPAAAAANGAPAVAQDTPA